MLVVTLGDVVLTSTIAPRQVFVDGVECLRLAIVRYRPRLELDHGLLG